MGLCDHMICDEGPHLALRVPMLPAQQVEALLDRIEGQPSAMQYIAERFEALGYTSWAYRIVNSSGAPRSAHPLRGFT